MLSAIVGDLRLYRRLVAMQLRAQAQYKASLAIDIGTYLAVTGLEFVALLMLYGPFPTLFGWKVGEVTLLYGLTAISFGLAEMIGAGIDNFAATIRQGEFDRVLLRPVGAFMQVIGSDFRLRRLGRVTQGIAALAIALHLLPNLHWTALKLLAMAAGLASGAAIFVAILLLGATMCFWTVETTELTNILTYGGCTLLSYPLTIYTPTLQRFFLYVVPLAFGSFVPACFVLGRPLPFGLPRQLAFGAPLTALLFALLVGAAWRTGVRHYQSTGS